MSRFYSEVTSKGQRSSKETTQTKMGDRSGMRAHLRGWNIGVEVYLEVNEEGRDEIRVYRTKGSNDRFERRIELIAFLEEEKNND